jgi:hypothetical protein
VRLAVAGTPAPPKPRCHDGCRTNYRGHDHPAEAWRSDFRKEAAMYSGGISPNAPLGELLALHEGERPDGWR